ncbi:hypothetical protein GE09DRAFT_1063640 [Coniochaeta sp. 2T2.1]|nr:hypothetical protein GE09DRAFT_1063640 [Coniochaeta sp. 2T2.1]
MNIQLRVISSGQDYEQMGMDVLFVSDYETLCQSGIAALRKTHSFIVNGYSSPLFFFNIFITIGWAPSEQLASQGKCGFTSYPPRPSCFIYHNPLTNLTFVTPIDRVFGHIESVTGFVRQACGDLDDIKPPTKGALRTETFEQ